jgi:hypothetical protein
LGFDMGLLDKYMTDDTEKRDTIVESHDSTNEWIRKMFNDYLKQPRFDGDVCLVLTMPEATLKKYSEKINACLWWMYNTYCKKDFGMMQLLVALEKMIDATKLASMLDMDIKLLVAKESGIAATEADIELAASKTEHEGEMDEPIKMSKELSDKLLEDDPEEEAFILAGLQD